MIYINNFIILLLEGLNKSIMPLFVNKRLYNKLSADNVYLAVLIKIFVFILFI